MTRPSGKSPAARRAQRSQLGLEQLSVIDVSLEDDSLLPFANKALQGSSHESPSVKMLDVIQEDLPESDSILLSSDLTKQTDLQSPSAAQEPALKNKKKKRSHFNLRKSLAWNNAFLTDEGVLDPEELSFVNRTFKKPPDLPRPKSHKKIMQAARRVEPTVIPKLDEKSMLTLNSQQIQTYKSGSVTGAVLYKSRSSTGLAPTKQVMGMSASRVQAEPVKQQRTNVKPNRLEFSGSKASLSKKETDSLKKGSGRPVAGGASAQKGTPGLSQDGMSFSRTVTAVSRKMKDTLGVVLSGYSSTYQKGTSLMAKGDSLVSAPPHSAPYMNSSDSNKVARCHSHSSFERFGRSPNATSLESVSSKGNLCPESFVAESRNSSQLEKSSGGGVSSCTGWAVTSCTRPEIETLASRMGQPVPSSHQLFQESASAKLCHTSSQKEMQFGGGSGAPLYNAKPSGLRMPSPKLGFFDTARAGTNPQVSILAEKTNCMQLDGAGVGSVSGRFPSEVGGYSQQSPGLKLQGSWTKSRQQLSASGPEIRGNSIPSGIPSAPHVRNHPISSKISMSPTLAHFSPRSIKSSSSTSSTEDSNRRQVKQNDKNVQTVSGEHPHTLGHSTSEKKTDDSNLGEVSLDKKRMSPHLTFSCESSRSGPAPKAMQRDVVNGNRDCVSNGNLDTTVAATKALQCRTERINGNDNSIRQVAAALQGHSSESPNATENASVFNGSIHLPDIRSSLPSTRSHEGCESSLPMPSQKVIKTLQVDKKGDCSPGPTAKDTERFSARSPFSMNNMNVLDRQGSNHQSKRDKGSIFAFAKKIMNQLTSTPSQDASEQENALPCDQNEEHNQIAIDCDGSYVNSICPLSEDDYSELEASQEWPQAKSGAVQHSPPDKTSPKPGPWSPVRRHSQALGPFDCTKYINTGLLH